MVRRFEAIELTRSFRRSAAKLSSRNAALGEQVGRTLDELLQHPEAPGLHREPIACSWSDDLWSCRVNGNVRLLEDESAPLRALAVYVDWHDVAYRWARRHRPSDTEDMIEPWHGSEQNSTGALPADGNDSQPSFTYGESSEDTLQNLRYLGAAAPGEEDYSCIPIESLCGLGLEREDAERIRRAPANAQLGAYLPARLVAAILDIWCEHFAPVPTDDGQEALSDDSTPMPMPLASDDAVVTITSPGQFRRMLEVGLERYLMTLTERQKELAHTDQRGLLVVQGVGGSGKTTVAVHRLRYLADRISLPPELQATGARRVIYLCFNSALAGVVKQMLNTLYGGQPPEYVEVATAHQWARAYLERCGMLTGSHNGLGVAAYRRVRNDLEGFLKNRLQARRAVSPQALDGAPDLSARFIGGEIREVIMGRGLNTFDDYLNAEREGRSRGLRQSERRFMWDLYEEWLRALDLDAAIDLSMLPQLALYRLANDTTFTPYEAVIVDEAQDLTPVGLRLAQQLAGRQLAHITIFGDAAQSIYRSGFRWSQAELNPRGRQLQQLTQNHRNTAQIWNLASAFLERGDGPDEPDGYVSAEEPTANGVLPILLTYPDAEAELRDVVLRVQTQLAAGVPLQNIGILAGTHIYVDELVKALQDAHIATEEHDVSSQKRIHITHPSVKVLTMHSAKGLDFPHVYLVGLTEKGIPDSQSDLPTDGVQQDAYAMQRRLLYTSMIRAGQTLVMTTVAKQPHPLLADLKAGFFRDEVVSAK